MVDTRDQRLGEAGRLDGGDELELGGVRVGRELGGEVGHDLRLEGGL